MKYQQRDIERLILKAASQFPAVILTGARQTGKTTTVKHLFGDTHRYVSLDDPLTKTQAIEDPYLLLKRFPPPIILDEIQYAPQLLHLIKILIDENRHTYGRFIITGSQIFPLMQGVTESLAGRAAILDFPPMSIREVCGLGTALKNSHSLLEESNMKPPSHEKRIRFLFRGGYPEVALADSARGKQASVNRDLDVNMWFSSYVSTYLERDVRNIQNIGNLRDFQRFLLALAVRTSSPVNMSDVGRDIGVTYQTIKTWISILETTGQITTITPFYVNVGKRLTKKTKVYFSDTGLLSYLLGIQNEPGISQGMAAGPLFETAVLAQIRALHSNRGENRSISFWRTAAGHEVDFLIQEGINLTPVEAKITATPKPRDADSIERFIQLLSGRKDRMWQIGKGFLVCLCDGRIPLTRNVDAIPFGSF